MKTVMIFGTFDGVHKGHRHLFRQAKAHGDFLIVVVARDSTVLAVKKRKPKYNECVRYALLHGESEIDLVILGNRKDKYAVVRKYKPEVICLGYDQERFVEGLQKIFSGEIVRLPAFHPDIYKSSKIQKEADVVARAKSALRNVLLTRRRSLPLEQRKQSSKIIVQSIFSLSEVQNADTILLYQPMGSEVDIRILFSLLGKEEKIVLVPFTSADKEIQYTVVTAETPYRKGVYGYPIPLHPVPYVGKIDTCIVPCVGWDRDGNRLGRGGGWYDRFLAKHKDTVPIGVAFAEQEVECLPTEKYDKKMATLCTTSKKNLPVVYRCGIFLKQ